jgi:predicted ester cyclase
VCIVADGDKVVTRWTVQATHQGELNGIPATGKRVTVTAMTIDRITDGKVIESWTIFDALGLMQQLGVVPSPGQGG